MEDSMNRFQRRLEVNTIASSDPPGIIAARGSALRQSSSLHSAAATAQEILWSVLLVIVIVFLLARGPALSAAAQDLAAAVHQARTPAAESPAVAAASESQELAARLARDENQLVALERKYAELKQRLAPPAPKGLEPAPIQGPKMKPAKPR
jgi:Sec-independent protein translocase protein TatA